MNLHAFTWLCTCSYNMLFCMYLHALYSTCFDVLLHEFTCFCMHLLYSDVFCLLICWFLCPYVILIILYISVSRSRSPWVTFALDEAHVFTRFLHMFRNLRMELLERHRPKNSKAKRSMTSILRQLKSGEIR